MSKISKKEGEKIMTKLKLWILLHPEFEKTWYEADFYCPFCTARRGLKDIECGKFRTDRKIQRLYENKGMFEKGQHLLPCIMWVKYV